MSKLDKFVEDVDKLFKQVDKTISILNRADDLAQECKPESTPDEEPEDDEKENPEP